MFVKICLDARHKKYTYKVSIIFYIRWKSKKRWVLLQNIVTLNMYINANKTPNCYNVNWMLILILHYTEASRLYF